MQLLILLKHQKVVLQLSQLPLRPDAVQPGQDLGNHRIMLAKPVLIAKLPVLVCVEGKAQRTILKGGKLLAESLLPRLKPSIAAHPSQTVKEPKILFLNPQPDLNPHRLAAFVEIMRRNLVGAADRADGV